MTYFRNFIYIPEIDDISNEPSSERYTDDDGGVILTGDVSTNQTSGETSRHSPLGARKIPLMVFMLLFTNSLHRCHFKTCYFFYSLHAEL